MDGPAGGLLIYDGDCGFCTSAAMWVSRAWPPGPRAEPWQQLGAEGLQSLGLSLQQAQDAAWWVDDSGQLFRGDRAIAESLRRGRGWRRLVGVLLGVPPLSWCSAALYPLVVRYRYQLPGGTPACRVVPLERRHHDDGDVVGD